MFFECFSLSNIDFSNFNSNNVINMEGIFCGCSSLESIDLSNFNINNIKYKCYMFYKCFSLKNINLSNFKTNNDFNIFIIFECPSLNDKKYLMEIDEYTIKKLIGKGVYGDVYLGSKKGSKIKYAFKKIDKTKYLENPKALKYLENEIFILKDINHPNIIKLIDVKETLENVFIITEYYNGGTLADCLDKYQNENN